MEGEHKNFYLEFFLPGDVIFTESMDEAEIKMKCIAGLKNRGTYSKFVEIDEEGTFEEHDLEDLPEKYKGPGTVLDIPVKYPADSKLMWNEQDEETMIAFAIDRLQSGRLIIVRNWVEGNVAHVGYHLIPE